MRKNNPIILLLGVFVFSVIAFVFSFSVLSKASTLENPFTNSEPEIIKVSSPTPTKEDFSDAPPLITQALIDTDVQITEFSSEKLSYSSQENINFTIKILSEKSMNNVMLKIEGIKPGNTYYINRTKTVDLRKGENIILISAQAPSCTSGCGGVYPGPYEVTAKVVISTSEVSTSQLTINLIDN